MSEAEWELIEMAYQCLKIPAALHSELSAEKMPTCHKVYPLVIHLLVSWTELKNDPGYDIVRTALDAGIKNMKKWYQSVHATPIYFITHGACIVMMCFSENLIDHSAGSYF